METTRSPLAEINSETLEKMKANKMESNIGEPPPYTDSIWERKGTLLRLLATDLLPREWGEAPWITLSVDRIIRRAGTSSILKVRIEEGNGLPKFAMLQLFDRRDATFLRLMLGIKRWDADFEDEFSRYVADQYKKDPQDEPLKNKENELPDRFRKMAVKEEGSPSKPEFSFFCEEPNKERRDSVLDESQEQELRLIEEQVRESSMISAEPMFGNDYENEKLDKIHEEHTESTSIISSTTTETTRIPVEKADFSSIAVNVSIEDVSSTATNIATETNCSVSSAGYNVGRRLSAFEPPGEPLQSQTIGVDKVFRKLPQDWTDNQKEDWLVEQFHSWYSTEKKVYEHLIHQQGHYIPRLITKVSIPIDKQGYPEAFPMYMPPEAQKYLEIQGLLFNYIDGFTLDDVRPDLNDLQLCKQLCGQALRVTELIREHGIINANAVPANIIQTAMLHPNHKDVDPTYSTGPTHIVQTYMFDFAQCIIRNPSWNKARWTNEKMKPDACAKMAKALEQHFGNNVFGPGGAKAFTLALDGMPSYGMVEKTDEPETAYRGFGVLEEKGSRVVVREVASDDDDEEEEESDEGNGKSEREGDVELVIEERGRSIIRQRGLRACL